MSQDVISDASNAGTRPSSAADPKRSPDIPRTPHMKRKSISVDKPLYEPGKQRTSLAPKHKQSAKMDVARAMGIMGFNSSRWLECSQVNIIFHNWDWSFCFNIKHFLIDLLQVKKNMHIFLRRMEALTPSRNWTTHSLTECKNF